ncbi:YeeE/YedE family protein [Sphingomicrobium aestuariivivum]|uniref:YeeE/YedE family protein n=1 Tax=Sphingomicrobium aestuariivivum TaxID=1582356 RepID=UPI001FD6E829|nr:YeeE/YedE thiosulfate transporter family protein [Sphingomicrobium aestuariivivum]MCJ8191817.1 YeeE/YedE family protein [Sphingomicrobium aestuariivivum]
MTIPGFEHAQPLEGLVGGLMIGLAAAIMLLGIGRIAGVSGLTARAAGIADSGPPRSLAITFIIALVLGAVIVQFVTGTIEARFPPEMWMLIAAGLFVGFGTRMGSGCTSGHGVCGMSRLSQRSISATLTFMGAGIATVALMNALGKGW